MECIATEAGPSGTPRGGLWFQLLGPLGVRSGDSWLRLGGNGQRSLLAALLLNANHVVSSGQLVEAIWGDAPPRSALAKLQTHVSVLRQTLMDPPHRWRSCQVLATRPPGYEIAIGPDQLDLSRFEVLADEGLRLLPHHPVEGAARLGEALALWRGPALDGIDLGGSFAHEAARLEERRFAVLEERIEADLRLGRHAELVAELEALALSYPLRERLHAQLMLALYRTGRRAESLAAFRRARRILAEELGLDPGHDLQRMERAILTSEAALEASAPGPTPALAGARAVIVVVVTGEGLDGVLRTLRAGGGGAAAIPPQRG